jgi:hypothetical protein
MKAVNREEVYLQLEGYVIELKNSEYQLKTKKINEKDCFKL